MKLVLCCLVLGGLVVLSPNESVAQSQTSDPTSPLVTFKGVVTLCKSNDKVVNAFCGAYVTGFVQGSDATRTAAVIQTVAREVARGDVAASDIDAAAAKRSDEIGHFCVRSTWTSQYVRAHVVQYALEHPEGLNDPAGDQMLKVLAKAFPCGPTK
jgi:hypothetical protein